MGPSSVWLQGGSRKGQLCLLGIRGGVGTAWGGGGGCGTQGGRKEAPAAPNFSPLCAGASQGTRGHWHAGQSLDTHLRVCGLLHSCLPPSLFVAPDV